MSNKMTYKAFYDPIVEPFLWSTKVPLTEMWNNILIRQRILYGYTSCKFCQIRMVVLCVFSDQLFLLFIHLFKKIFLWIKLFDANGPIKINWVLHLHNRWVRFVPTNRKCPNHKINVFYNKGGIPCNLFYTWFKH